MFDLGFRLDLSGSFAGAKCDVASTSAPSYQERPIHFRLSLSSSTMSIDNCRHCNFETADRQSIQSRQKPRGALWRWREAQAEELREREKRFGAFRTLGENCMRD